MLFRGNASGRVLTGTGSSEPGRGTSDRMNSIRAHGKAQRKRAVPETPTEPANLLLPQHFIPQLSRIRSHGETGVGPGCGETEPSGAQGAWAAGSLPDGD